MCFARLFNSKVKLKAVAKSVSTRPIKSVHIALDYDGCSDTYEAQKKIIVYLVKTLKTLRRNGEPIHEVTLSIGSLRQSKLADDCNAKKNRNGSCFEMFMIMEEMLTTALRKSKLKGIEVSFCKRLYPDVIFELPPGTTFDQAVKYNKKGSYFFCETSQQKYEIILMGMMNQPDLYIFVDDKLDLLLNLYTWMNKYNYLFSEGTLLKLVHCENFTHCSLRDYQDVVIGEGPSNRDYNQIIKAFAKSRSLPAKIKEKDLTSSDCEMSVNDNGKASEEKKMKCSYRSR